MSKDLIIPSSPSLFPSSRPLTRRELGLIREKMWLDAAGGIVDGAARVITTPPLSGLALLALLQVLPNLKLQFKDQKIINHNPAITHEEWLVEIPDTWTRTGNIWSLNWVSKISTAPEGPQHWEWWWTGWDQGIPFNWSKDDYWIDKYGNHYFIHQEPKPIADAFDFQGQYVPGGFMEDVAFIPAHREWVRTEPSDWEKIWTRVDYRVVTDRPAYDDYEWTMKEVPLLDQGVANALTGAEITKVIWGDVSGGLGWLANLLRK